MMAKRTDGQSSINHKIGFIQIVISMVLLLPLVEIPSETMDFFSESLGNLFNYVLFIDAIIVIFLYTIYGISNYRKPISPFTLLFGAYLFLLFTITVYSGGDIWTFLQKWSKCIYLIMVSELITAYNYKVLYYSLCPLLCALLISNIITMVLFPNGLYYSLLHHSSAIWLLGYKNYFIMYMFPLLFTLIIMKIDYPNMKSVTIVAMSIVIVCAASTFFARSDVGFIAVILLSLAVAVPSIREISCSVIRKGSLGINIFFFLGIVLGRVQNVFSFFIVNILGKDLSLNGRTRLWDNSLRSISESPIFGYGVEAGDITKAKIGHSHTHNIILWNLYEGGIALLLAFFGLLIVVFRMISNNPIAELKSCLYYSLGVLLLVWQLDACEAASLFFVLSLIANLAFYKNE